MKLADLERRVYAGELAQAKAMVRNGSNAYLERYAVCEKRYCIIVMVLWVLAAACAIVLSIHAPRFIGLG